MTVYPQVAGTFFYVDQKCTASWNAKVRAGILYERRNFVNKYGFSLANLPAAAWELVPWSFVVDWFVEVGTFIRAITPRIQSIRRATWTTTEVTADLTYETNLTWRNVSGHEVVQAQSGVATQRFVHRKRLPYVAKPTLYVRDNFIDEIKNSKRAIDSFALTWSTMMKLLSRTKVT